MINSCESAQIRENGNTQVSSQKACPSADGFQFQFNQSPNFVN